MLKIICNTAAIILLTFPALASLPAPDVVTLQTFGGSISPLRDQYYQFDFGTTFTNSPVYRDFHLNNGGPGDLYIYQMSITPGDFSAVHYCPQILYPRNYCTIRIRFLPLNIGASHGRMQIETSSGLITMDLTGWGRF
ncbi:MAG: hypothetical protein IPM97_10495 [Bdellovibrionaceae bacterium]|nr:hypothetical protein [Pseudobdellovibrionaceae bacterium]